MPTFESLAAFQRQWAKLDPVQRIAFKRALAVFVANLRDGDGFSPELRIHKLANTEIWSLSWAKDGRALFRFGSEIVKGQTHIVWEAIGTPRRDLRPDVAGSGAAAGGDGGGEGADG